MKLFGITGTFHIKADRDFETTVKIVNEATNLNLQHDDSGYYEEFPAYSNYIMGINFALLGIPKKEYQFDFGKYDKYDFLILSHYKFKTEERIDLGFNLMALLNNKTELNCYTDKSNPK